MACERCIMESRINNIFTRPPQQNPREHITGPEDAMQFDLVPEQLPPSAGYQTLLQPLTCFAEYFLTTLQTTKILNQLPES